MILEGVPVQKYLKLDMIRIWALHMIAKFSLEFSNSTIAVIYVIIIIN